MWNCKRIIFIATAVVANIFWGLYFALLPPFYPSEAEKKGASPSQVSFILFVYNH